MMSRPARQLAALAAMLLLSSLATAAQRTFVASSGSDAHACSLSQPCRSFAAAIAQTSPGGEVVVLDSSGYGPVTITQSVSIVAPAGIYAGITVFSGSGVTVDAASATVVLRGIAINGQGGANGVAIQSASRVRIEGCVISGLTSHAILQTTSAELAIVDTIVRDNAGDGIRIAGDGAITLDRVRSEHNGGNGFYIAATTIEANASITDSVLSANGGSGIFANGSADTQMAVAVDRSIVANNGGDGIFAYAAPGGIELTITRNVIERNRFEGVEIVGQSVPHFIVATVTENAFARNGDYAIRCIGTEIAFVFASRNASSLLDENGTFQQGGSCQFATYGNNEGGHIFSGSISPAGGY